MLAFTAVLTLVTAVLFGFAPAIQAARGEVAGTLKDESGSITATGSQARMRRLLAGAQIALSLLLLVGAGLFARSLYTLLRVNPGIQADKLLAFSIDPSLHKYTPERARQLEWTLQIGLRRLPGAVSASAASFPLLAEDNWENTAVVEGYHPVERENTQARWNEVLPGFFSTMGIPLIAGREFTDRDTAGAPRVTIVNESFVKRFYPHQNPLGRHVGFGGPPTIEIVGVVKNFKIGDLKEGPLPCTYTPALQEPHPAAMTFYVRSSGDPRSLIPAVRQVAARLAPMLPVYDLKTVPAQINETHFIDRLFAMLSAAFGVLATVLAAVGLYGVTAYGVTRRTKEIGVRMALGAGRDRILWMVMREVLMLGAAGLVLGLAAALALGRLVESQLFGIKGRDPLVIIVAAGAILAISALSGFIPAWRATRIDPMQALHYE